MQKSSFRDGGKVLRVFEQATRNGKNTVPLKHRKAGEYRDIPVPSYLWEMVKDLPDGREVWFGAVESVLGHYGAPFRGS